MDKRALVYTGSSSGQHFSFVAPDGAVSPTLAEPESTTYLCPPSGDSLLAFGFIDQGPTTVRRLSVDGTWKDATWQPIQDDVG